MKNYVILFLMRVNKVGLILGRRGSGKTYYTKNSLIPAYMAAHPGQKVLIVDTLDHPDYRHVQSITPDMIRRWSGGGIYRCFTRDTNAILREIDGHLSNALVIFEDATKYIRKNLQEEVRIFIVDSKQRNLDIVFMFHGFAACPPEFFRLADFVTMFRTDDPRYRRSDIPVYDQVEEAYTSINNSLNKYERKTVIIS